MAALSHSDSRRLYSWWWDSHNSPKNSKWLQDNLKDIDSKVKLMIKLLEEDADSFARRAEMYYKKRPELMKLVEEFYRAYRALAERYNHATGELRHAHRALAKAFPDQLPVELVEEDSPQKPLAHKNEPQTPETKIDEAFHDDVSVGNLKVKSAEEKCLLLEISNLSLQKEAEDLGKKIAAKDQQLSDKNEEFEKLQTRLQDEESRFAKAEATLQSLQDLHSRSRDDQRALSLELENVLHMVKCLEEEIRFVQEEKQSLSETNLSLIENMQKEILALREMKESLEKEVSHHTELSNSLQLEITRLKEVIEVLNTSYRTLGEQVEAVGVSPKCVGSSIKSLQDENLKMREINEEGSNEREILSKKLKDIQESCEFLNGEKALLVSEKASLMSQLEVITNNMHKLLEKNAVLEHNLYTARVELEGLREKSKGLEEICRLLKDERSHLLHERSNLLLRLENVERRLESSEKRYIGLEEKYVDLEKEKEAVNCQVEELKISLFIEKQERSSSELQRDTRLAGLENKIHYLKEENGWKKKEYEEEVEKSLKAEFEISILQKFIKDMEEKNCSLVIECHKHVEASKLAEKLIMELESESLEQQVEGELLLDEIERLRLRIYQVFRSLETGSDFKDNIENERAFVDHIVGAIEDMKCSISKHENEKELLVVENSVLLTLLEQLELKVNKDNANLVKKFSDLKEEKHKVDQHCNAALLECLETSTKSVILRRFGEEKVSEVKSLLSDLNIQHEINCNLEKEMSALGEKLGLQKEENLFLKDGVRTLEGEIQGMKECNVEMKKEILSGKESLLETKGALFDTEVKLHRSMQINENLEKEMESLNVIRANLEAEISQLRKQMEEKTVREQALCLDLQEKSNEFELWEAEAMSFYFDLQISSVNEVLFKNKVEELSGVCRLLENENVLKLSEIEQMKRKICLMENEISGLKSEQYAYNPVIAALREDIMLLEHNPLLQTKAKPSGNREQEILEVGEDPKTSNSEIVVEDESLISLRNLQVRVKAVGKLMEETKKPVAYRRSISKSKQESARNEIKPNRCLRRKKGGDEISNTPKLHKIKPKANGMLIKDIPLDQVTSSSLKGKRKKGSGRADKVTDRDALYNDLENVKHASEPPFNKSDAERLTSDAQQLEVLQTTVQDLRSKLETNKKSSRKGKSVDFETIQEQLLEAEETIVHLVDLNGELVKSIEDEYGKDSPQVKEAVETRRELTEEARKGSERIGRLQLELQKIQYILLQVEEEKKNKGRNKFLKSKTIVLRDFFYNGRKKSGRRKQSPPFGCFRPSTSTNGSSP